jgi:hypothetical protein
VTNFRDVGRCSVKVAGNAGNQKASGLYLHDGAL